MKIRKITKDDDFEAIGNVYSSSWKSAYRGIVPQDYLDALNGSQWSSLLASSEYDTYVILDGIKYIGTSSVCAARDKEMNGWGEIISIYLLPEYFGKGYATQLFDHVTKVLLDKGYKNIYLWVLDENIHAQSFYKKNGFVKNGDTVKITISGKELNEIRYIKRFE